MKNNSHQPQRTKGIQTRLIHTPGTANETTAVTPPIFQTSTYQMPTPEEGAEIASEVAPSMFYTRYGSPNRKQVEVLLADLEGSQAALVVGSGMAAIATALMGNVRAGDHVVAQQTHYTATMTLFAEHLPRYGVEVTQVDQCDPQAFAQALRPNTRILYTETPTNPTLELTNLRETARLAHENGALAITDNTFASCYNQHPLELGYDLIIHSATKYLNGHADVMAGAIMGSQALIDAAWEYQRVHGPVLSPFEAWLLRRGLQTYGLRMAVHNQNAFAVAHFLEQHPAISRVYYPGLPSHPQHKLAREQMPGGFGGMLSFEMKDGYNAAYRVMQQTEICLSAVSLGGVETLITHPASMIHSHLSEAELAQVGIAPGLLRLSVGVENIEDLLADLDQALSFL